MVLYHYQVLPRLLDNTARESTATLRYSPISTTPSSPATDASDVRDDNIEEVDKAATKSLALRSKGRSPNRTYSGRSSRLNFTDYPSFDTRKRNHEYPRELSVLATPAFQLSSGLDQRSLRTLNLFFYEGQRAMIVTPSALSLSINLFYQEPAYRNLMCALITLVNAEYEPQAPDSKAYVYQCILNAIRRMRDASHEMDDESQLRCRALLALLETVRVHEERNFKPIFDAAAGLFESWEKEMDTVPVHVALRRQKVIAKYSSIFKPGIFQWKSLNAVHPLPQLLPEPDFQSNFFEFLSGMELTTLITESYGYSICEPVNRAGLEGRLQAWYTAFQTATSNPETLGLYHVIQARFYLAHYIRGMILLDACVPETEALYSKHDKNFADLLECVERVLASDCWQHEGMWLGIVCLVFFTAVHCRQRILRQKALAILKSHDISERSWNSRIAFLIASAVAAIESKRMSDTRKRDRSLVRLLSADFRNGSGTLVIKYIDVQTKEQHTFSMLVADQEDLRYCQQLSMWPLVAEVRTHGAAFSRSPMGGPMDNVQTMQVDYTRWVKRMLMPKKHTLQENAKGDT